MKFQHAYSESVRTSDLECKDPSLTQQQFTEDADINVLLERFKVTGQLPTSISMPTFADFRNVPDFRTAQELLLKAKHAFMDVPPDIRRQFNDDPMVFADFCSDEKNLPRLRELGLAKALEPVSDPAVLRETS